MITRLTFGDFGKFQGVSFDLGRMNVVYGPNEAGKTTFFDGLFQALCDPSETKKSGKLLKARYGAHRKATLTMVDTARSVKTAPISANSVKAVSVSDDEFLNLFAIRAGDLRLELSQGSDWMEKLKSRLFHGGLDPKILADEYERRSSDKRIFLHNKELDALRDKLGKAKVELDGHRRERESLLAKEKSLGDLEASLQATRKLRETEEEKLHLLDREQAFEDRIALRQKLSAQLARLEDWEALEASIENLAAFKDVRREDWERLNGAVQSAAIRLQTERGKKELQADLAAKARAEIRELSSAKEAAASRSLVADKLAESIRAAMSQKANGGIPVGLAALAATASMASGGVGAWLVRGRAGFALAALGIVFAVVSMLAGIRRGKHRARHGMEKSLAQWKDEWRLVSLKDASSNRSGPGMASFDIAGIVTAEGFLQAMEACSREKDTLARQEQESAHRLHELETALARLDQVLVEGRNAEEDAVKAERQWLQRLGVESGEAFLLKVSRLADLESQRPKRKADLEAMVEGAGLSGFARELNRKLKDLDEEGIPLRGRDEAALQRLRRDRHESQSRMDSLARDEREKIAQTKVVAGEVGATLGKLAAEIVKWEDRLAEAEAEIESKELDKRAAALALEIFRGIGDGTELLWAGLGQEMEAMLGNILPGGRNISLQGLGTGQIQVQDASGTARPLENLSTGTKDAVVLAAKLALALKSRTEAGILVLDDPFLAMDEERETRALQLLRTFQDRHGWQIILLTKEISLRDKVLRLFVDPMLVDLTIVR